MIERNTTPHAAIFEFSNEELESRIFNLGRVRVIKIDTKQCTDYYFLIRASGEKEARKLIDECAEEYKKRFPNDRIRGYVHNTLGIDNKPKE